MNKYIYSESDFSATKNLYMYSNEEWDTFLETYKNHREKICLEIKGTSDLSTLQIKEPLPKFSKEFDTLMVIDRLLNSQLTELNCLLYLQFLLKKLESTKVIFIRYPKDQETEEITLPYYIKLSYLFSEYIKKHSDIRFLNILLKLNDKIIHYKKQWIDGEYRTYVFFALSQEMKIVENIRTRLI